MLFAKFAKESTLFILQYAFLFTARHDVTVILKPLIRKITDPRPMIGMDMLTLRQIGKELRFTLSTRFPVTAPTPHDDQPNPVAREAPETTAQRRASPAR